VTDSRTGGPGFRLGLLAILATTAAATAGCKVNQAAFDARVFACDPSARDPGCGRDDQGTPMTCYPGSLLDGTDFCAPGCGDTPMTLPDGNVCVGGGAELAFCDPSTPSGGTGPCGTTQLDCLRTDVTSQEGVCTTMTPCSLDQDCSDPVRSTCAATFLKELYAKNTTMQADHLYCLQKNCQSGASACSPGQSCLPLLVPAAAHAPDICVPNCDAQGNCPPNHVCYRKISGPANPAICIPGLLGFICESDIDCLVGTCHSDEDPTPEDGLKLCTIGCDRDDECSIFDSNQGTFFCAIGAGVGGKSGHCEMPAAYRGNACRTDDDCTRDVGTTCFYSSPPTSPKELGTCLRSCDATGACAPRAGIGHTCLPFYTSAGAPAGGCFPGFFPYPCLTSANCVGDLTCRGADLTASPPVVGHCTTLCQTDDDCAADRWTAGQSFCGAGVCLPLQAGGAACATDGQCQSKRCQPDSASSGGGNVCAEVGA
jgi:hypothetical protein